LASLAGLGWESMFKISFDNIFIMDAAFAGLCENVNNFSKDGLFANDNPHRSMRF
jgi:hypothetical protein